MENKKLKSVTVGSGVSGSHWDRVLNEKAYDEELFGKEDIYPKSMMHRRTILFRNSIAEMELGKSMDLSIKSDNQNSI